LGRDSQGVAAGVAQTSLKNEAFQFLQGFSPARPQVGFKDSPSENIWANSVFSSFAA